MVRFARTIVAIAICLALVCGAFADDFASCGGFVKSSRAIGTKFDYSDISIKLVSPDGAVKQDTVVAPNGYYLIPVYDKGAYLVTISGPSGWSFEPSEFAVNIDDSKTCNAGADINFELTGFTVSGQIVSDSRCKSGATGVSGISVTLRSQSGKGSSQMIKSDSNGKYSFKNVVPGKYFVEASHPTWHFSQNKVSVEVSWGATTVSDKIIVAGFDLSGRVVIEGNDGIENVDIILYTKDKSISVAGCDDLARVSKLPHDVKNIGSAVCVTKSDHSGKFSFAGLPCGAYTVVPVYKPADSTATFALSPSYQDVEVDRQSATLISPFAVSGFSIFGKVVDHKKRPVVGATVKVSGTSLSAKTNKDGKYKFDKIESGNYEITAELNGYKFQVLNAQIAPSVSELPDITVTHLAICGKVIIPHSPLAIDTRSIGATREGITGVMQKRIENNEYCLYVGPGAKYTVSPLIYDKERELGLRLVKDVHVIDELDAPALDVDFVQSLLSISGRVNCISTPCDSSVLSIELTGSDDETIATSLAPQGGDGFNFPHLLSGKFRVAVKSDNWCWDEDAFDVVLDQEDITNIEFKQTGYLLKVVSSHAMDVELGTQGEKISTWSIKKGENTKCIKKAGNFILKPISCYQFGKESFSWSTDAPKTISLQAKNLKVSGKIEITNVPKGFSAKDLSVSFGASTGQVKQVQSDEKSSVFEYEHWADLSESVVITPSVKKSALFFYPPTLTAAVSENDCLPELPTIQARPGVFIKGSVKPHVEGAKISVITKETGESVLAEPATVSKDGTYTVGPFPDDQDYIVSAEAPGFYLKGDGNGNFQAMKFGSVKVTVKRADGAPVAGVLVSLSGEGYRNNNATGADGTFLFSNLFPGDYYMIPILKEYEFAPKTKTVTVQEGKEVSESLVATRNAYSVFGVVRSLNGQPEKLITVEAVTGDNQLVEESQTDDKGNFRLRGLLPGKDYNIRVRTAGNQRVDRASPSTTPVKIVKDDVTSVDFIVIRRVARYELTGRVQTNESFVSSLIAQLFDDEDMTKAVKEVKLGPGNFFDFIGLSKTAYTLRIKSTLPTDEYTYKVQDTKVKFTDADPQQSINIVFEASIKSTIADAPASQAFSLLFFVGIFAIVYFNKEVAALLKKHFNIDAETILAKLRKNPSDSTTATSTKKAGKAHKK